jgi:hypothetical protein
VTDPQYHYPPTTAPRCPTSLLKSGHSPPTMVLKIFIKFLRGQYIGKYPISADVIWGEKYEKGKRKRGKVEKKKEERGKKKRKWEVKR